MEHVEKFYPVVGVLEDLPATFAAMENLLPKKFFSNMAAVYRGNYNLYAAISLYMYNSMVIRLKCLIIQKPISFYSISLLLRNQMTFLRLYDSSHIKVLHCNWEINWIILKALVDCYRSSSS